MNRLIQGTTLLFLLGGGLAACNHKYEVAPESALQSPATLTPTPTPSRTPSATPTATGTFSPTPSPTATPTTTATMAPGVLCTFTPSVPTYYTEAEPMGVGGPLNGTNENCSNAENLGTLTSGASAVVHGNLSASGNQGGTYDMANDDLDVYSFTAGPTGNYMFFLDCFSTGSDINDFDLVLFDSTCTGSSSLWGATGLYLGATTGYDEFFTYSLTGGQTYYLGVVGWTGAPLSAYRLSIQAP